MKLPTPLFGVTRLFALSAPKIGYSNIGFFSRVAFDTNAELSTEIFSTITPLLPSSARIMEIVSFRDGNSSLPRT
ncbi:hypothetical protein ACLOJK_034414 [Asimina triloba]